MYCVLLNACSGTQPGTDISETRPVFDLKVEQNGKAPIIANNTVVLSKDTFDLIFTIRDQVQILVNVHPEPESFDQANNGVPLGQITGFRETGMAEYPFNKDLAIAPRKEAPHMWYYFEKSDHRFNRVKPVNDLNELTRTIAKVSTRNKETIDISNYSPDQLYFVFINYEFDQTLYTSVEYSRKTLKVVFE